MVVTFHSPVHDNLVALLPDPLSGYINIDPVGISPHAWIDLAKLDRRTCVVHYGVSEIGIEVSIVEEYVGIMKPSIEVPFE